MRKILFCLVILLLSFSCRLLSQTRGIEFYHYNSDNVRILESLFQYNVSPYEKNRISILGQSSWEDRLNFHQETRRSMLGSSIAYSSKHFSHTLLMDYESYFDTSDLEPVAYVNKNGKLGYRLDWTPIDSLFLGLATNGIIRNEKDRYIQESHRSSDGFQVLAHSSYRYISNIVNAGFRANYEKKEMNWESYRDFSATADLNGEAHNMYWESSFSLNQRLDNIYTLEQSLNQTRSSYSKQDEQKRSGMGVYGFLEYNPHNKIALQLSENYNERRIRLKENTIRNNGEFYNDLDIKLGYEITSNLQLDIGASHNFAYKGFNILENTRNIENRTLNANTGWEYSPSDSLFAGLSINLQITSFPSNKKWDNDLRTRSARLGWKHYYKNFIRLSNWFNYSIREDVYLNSMLSANNHEMQSFTLFPEAEILLGDRIAFIQSYQIRTDYTDFLYSSIRTAKLYRQLGCKFNLIFDSYPYIARSGDDVWLQNPYRKNSGSAFSSNMEFSYEENQYADKQDEFYNINNKNRNYIVGITLKHDIDNFYYSIAPRISWGTWKEYSLSAGIYWTFNNASFIEFSLTPISENLEAIDVRSAINLSVVF
ncbi:MAG: hypothetical protein M0Q19_04170 [Candidatus Cloacimonetes bacterium]|nr:hypothetical protein [Candidatus Cloacimonadota bacterium]MCK9332356.1 hypothetical protein [Candidatus Cloacimonadota bacterium]